MILPTKGISAEMALLTLGAKILAELSESKTVSRLWADVRQASDRAPTMTFDWFVLALDLLFVMGTVEYVDGRITCVREADDKESS